MVGGEEVKNKREKKTSLADYFAVIKLLVCYDSISHSDFYS